VESFCDKDSCLSSSGEEPILGCRTRSCVKRRSCVGKAEKKYKDPLCTTFVLQKKRRAECLLKVEENLLVEQY